MDLRLFLFSNRSFTPIPIFIAILFYSEVNIYYLFLGIILIVLGESVRMFSVSYAGGQTRTMKVGAPFLCTSGPYSRTRNPLYIGNIIIYSGIVFFAGGSLMWEFLLIVILFFFFQYSLIISLEEEKLTKLFDHDYEVYKNFVPKLFRNIFAILYKKFFRSPPPEVIRILLFIFNFFLMENCLSKVIYFIF